jgi:hypothetical protein
LVIGYDPIFVGIQSKSIEQFIGVFLA